MADVDELQRSLGLARAGLGSPEGARARVRARLAERLPAADAASSSGAAGGGTATRAAGGAARAWTVGLMGLSFIAGYWLRGAQEPAAPDARASAAPLTMEAGQGTGAEPALQPVERAQQPPEPAREQPAASQPVPGGASGNAPGEPWPAPRAVARPRAPAAAPPADDSLAREVALLQRVERAIRAREGELALALLLEHERDFPASSLREERAAARVLGACVAQQGRVARARARADAERYLERRAHSVYADRIRTLCELERDPSSKESASSGH